MSIKKLTQKILFDILNKKNKKFSQKTQGDKKMYKAIDIARWFIYRSEQEEEKPTALKILKLLYYAQGCFLMLNDEVLFKENIMAWEHGPVVEPVWRAFPDSYNLTVTDKEMTDSLSKIDNYTNNFLEHVWNLFGGFTAWKLREMTHAEAPWIITTKNGKEFDRIIEKDVIKSYFSNAYRTLYYDELSSSCESEKDITKCETSKELIESLNA